MAGQQRNKNRINIVKKNVSTNLRHYRSIFVVACAIAILSIPFLFRPFAINIHADIGVQLLQVLRLADTQLSLSFDRTGLYSNTIIQLLSDNHGIIRQIVLFPIFFVYDKFGLPIHELSVSMIYLAVSLALNLVNYYFVKQIVGKEKAGWFILFMAIMPYFVMMAKAGWWQIFAIPSFLGSLAFIHKFLNKENQRDYLLFGLTFSVHILSTPSFILSAYFLFLYISLFYLHQYNNFRLMGLSLWSKFIHNWRILLPIATSVGLFLVSFIANIAFDSEQGSFSRIFSKSELPHAGIWVTILHNLAHGLGLLGFVTFPLIVTSIVFLVSRKKNYQTALVPTSLIYFITIFFLLSWLGVNTGAYIYELAVPGIFLLLFMFEVIPKFKTRSIILSLVILFTYAQTLLYNFGYTPTGWVNKTSFIFPYLDACVALWCPYHFADQKNIGIKTLGFIFKDEWKISPISFVSMDNSEEKQKEIFFWSGYYQGPVTHLGRRINFDLDFIDRAKVIVVYDDTMLQNKEFSSLKEEAQAKVINYLDSNPQFKLAAIITKGDNPVLKIYKNDEVAEVKTFPVEIFDGLYDKKYARLKDFAHLDLGY